jgi:carbon starvation protein CstA
MAVGVAGGILLQGYTIPEVSLANLHPANAPIWPLMFITVACGALSGFHATQSPMMARCMTSEKQGRDIFYGAMITEGVIALIWAAAGVAFYQTTGGLAVAITDFGGAAGVVYNITFSLLGPIGGVIAMLGVIACPITSGDTAFRSARLTLADWFKYEQRPIKNRLILAVPLLAIGYMITFLDYNVIWRYFAWSNQTLGMFVLWAGAVYLKRAGANHWIATVPATFMSAVSVTYILQAAEGFQLPMSISYPAGILFAVVVLIFYMMKVGLKKVIF